MKFAIIGNGFVGSAVAAAINERHQVVIHDPPKDLEVSFDSGDLDGVVICVPTPSHEDGSCDDSLVLDYYNEIRSYYRTVPIMIKSTTSIELLNSLDHNQDANLVFSPEFLTAANAKEEFMNPKFVIMSGNGTACSEFWVDDVLNHVISDPNKVYYMDKMADAGFVKYTINSFLAMKVTFFNEMYMLYQNVASGANFESVKTAVSMDSRIGASHMNVPGPDGMFGWGGACFPKDTSELLSLSERSNSPLRLLSKATELNREHRSYETD